MVYFGCISLVVWIWRGSGNVDFPVQNVNSARCGFKLMPSGFFSRNPMIDMAQKSAARSGDPHCAACDDEEAHGAVPGGS